jgi:hypothetical protein
MNNELATKYIDSPICHIQDNGNYWTGILIQSKCNLMDHVMVKISKIKIPNLIYLRLLPNLIYPDNIKVTVPWIELNLTELYKNQMLIGERTFVIKKENVQYDDA